MCDFLSACICRDGRIVCDGVHGHTELARRYIRGENGIGKQRFWEFELAPANWIAGTDPKFAIRSERELPPEAVIASSAALIAELSSLNGVSRLLPWLAVLRKGMHDYMPSDVRIIVLCGTAKLMCVDGAQTVICMWGSSQVGKMRGSSQVGEMWDSSQVGEMWDSSQVGEMWGSSRVGKMWDSSRVGKMWDSSQVGNMWDSSRAPRQPKVSV